jgi:hypothetical protein
MAVGVKREEKGIDRLAVGMKKGELAAGNFAQIEGMEME